jgi:hypothetical protein
LFAGFRGLSYVKHLAVAALVFTTSLLFAACSVAAVGFSLHFTGHAMSWFSNTWLIFGLYVTPAAGAVLLTCTAAKQLFYKVGFHISAICFVFLRNAYKF